MGLFYHILCRLFGLIGYPDKNEAESATGRAKDFLDSELPKMWSDMRSSISNGILRNRLPEFLPLRKIETVVIKADLGYKVQVSSDIAQAIDEAVQKALSYYEETGHQASTRETKR